MTALFPPIKPYKTHFLPVDSRHTLYIEETGNPNGTIVVALHSGPGHCNIATLRRFFDPEIYRIVTFDQRGCGRSTPHANVVNNTTQALIDDINKIKIHLNLDRFILLGGGWGALLALLYAENYPKQITHLILYSLFLGRKTDTAWLHHHGTNMIYPDYWEEFLNAIPTEHHHNVIPYYQEILSGSNELARLSLAKQWALRFAKTITLQPHQQLISEITDPHHALSLATLQIHYLSQHYFIKENQVLNDCDKIAHIPAYIIQGRYDMLCPLANAWELHKALPLSHLSIVSEAGHSEEEHGMQEAIVAATYQVISQEK